MNEQEIKELAKAIAEELKAHQDCQLSPEEQVAIRSLLNTKKSAIRVFLYIVGALVLWMLKDIYLFIMKHIGWNG